jgi:hypothetical protein
MGALNRRFWLAWAIICAVACGALVSMLRGAVSPSTALVIGLIVGTSFMSGAFLATWFRLWMERVLVWR